jgi:hypothetical protein
MFLKYNTASQEVLLGPFLDDTDGKTAETGLTIANTDIKVWKAGGTTEASKNSGGATHIAGGRYYAVLDATDTDTVGPLELNIHVSGALPVQKRLVVLPGPMYDAMIAGTTAMPADVQEWDSSSSLPSFFSLSDTYEGSETVQAFLRLARAVLFGKTTTSGTVFRNAADTKARVTVSVDANSNRTSVTTDAT